jgi:hypothetical protein
MKTLALTGGTQIKVMTLNAFVAKTFHISIASITIHTKMFLVLTCEPILWQNMYSSGHETSLFLKRKECER